VSKSRAFLRPAFFAPFDFWGASTAFREAKDFGGLAKTSEVYKARHHVP